MGKSMFRNMEPLNTGEEYLLRRELSSRIEVAELSSKKTVVNTVLKSKQPRKRNIPKRLICSPERTGKKRKRVAKVWKCKDCPKKLKNKGNWMYHTIHKVCKKNRYKQKPKEYSCPSCPKTFKSRNGLRYHKDYNVCKKEAPTTV